MKRLKDFALALVVWLVAVVHELRQAIAEARNPTKAKPKKFDPNHVPIILPPAMGPLVETTASVDPLPLASVPIRSTKADAKREALTYARKRSGKPDLAWKAARALLNKWGREERELERSMAPEYAERMHELSEATA